MEEASLEASSVVLAEVARVEVGEAGREVEWSEEVVVLEAATVAAAGWHAGRT